MARRSMAEIFETDEEESLTQCEMEDIEYSIDFSLESLWMKISK